MALIQVNFKSESLMRTVSLNAVIPFDKRPKPGVTQEIDKNRMYAKFLKDQQVPCTYEEGPGGHDWDFWDTFIKKVIDWLPLDD